MGDLKDINIFDLKKNTGLQIKIDNDLGLKNEGMASVQNNSNIFI